MTTLLVDGNNILARATFAAHGKHVQLSAERDGEEVNTAPLLIFINLLSRYVREVEPDRMVVCWDGGRSSYRTQLYPDYKAGRTERAGDDDKPESPFAHAKEFLTLAGIHHVELLGVEADDLVAAYWRVSMVATERVVILSGDKDFLQLVGPYCAQLRPGSGAEVRTTTSGKVQSAELWDTERVSEEFGCEPRRLPAVMALAGDKGDGVPGVPRVGVKTAVKFLMRNDWSLEQALTAEGRLAPHADLARTSLKLVDLRSDFGICTVERCPEFIPTAPGSLAYDDLVQWLVRYDMASVQDRLTTSTLWSGTALTRKA